MAKTKARKVMDLLNKAPGLTDRQVAEKVGCHANYVWMLRKKMVHVDPSPEETLELTPEMEVPPPAQFIELPADLIYQLSLGRNGRLSGGSNEYYKLHVTNPTSGGDPYIAECNDIIEGLGMTYAEGNAFKAIWRRAALRNGGGKPGSTLLYESEKVEFFGKRLVEQAREM